MEDTATDATRTASYHWYTKMQRGSAPPAEEAVILTLFTYPQEQRSLTDELQGCMAAMDSVIRERGGETNLIPPTEAAVPGSVWFAKGLRAHALLKLPGEALYTTASSLFLFEQQGCFIKVRVSHHRDLLEQVLAETNAFLLALEKSLRRSRAI